MSKGTVNKVIILGRLGQDPDVRTTSSGTQIVNLNVATTEIGKADEMGNRQELAEWHRITLFGRMAENAAQYLVKGSQVYIEGRLQTRKWQDQSGADRYSTDIIGNEMQFIGGKPAGQSAPQQQAPHNQPQGGFNQQSQQGVQQPHGKGFNQPAQQPAPNSAPQGFDDFSDEIPFS